MEATFDALLENFEILRDTVRKSVSKLWGKSKFFRIISLVTGSFAAAYSFRNFYIWSYRKIHRLPGGSYGLPLFGNGMNIIDPAWLKVQGSIGVVTSYMMGPNYGILINEPHLAKKFIQHQLQIIHLFSTTNLLN